MSCECNFITISHQCLREGEEFWEVSLEKIQKKKTWNLVRLRPYAQPVSKFLLRYSNYILIYAKEHVQMRRVDHNLLIVCFGSIHTIEAPEEPPLLLFCCLFQRMCSYVWYTHNEFPLECRALRAFTTLKLILDVLFFFKSKPLCDTVGGWVCCNPVMHLGAQTAKNL